MIAYADPKFVETMKFSTLPSVSAGASLNSAQLASIGVKICVLVYAGLKIALVLVSGMMVNASVFAQSLLLKKIAQQKTNTGTMSAVNAFAYLTMMMEKTTQANSGIPVLVTGNVFLKTALLVNTGR